VSGLDWTIVHGSEQRSEQWGAGMIDKAEVLALVDKLESFVGREPCDNSVAMNELRSVHDAIEYGELGGYVEEKMTALKGNLELWFGGRSWGRNGQDPDQIKAFINADFSKLRAAIETWFSHGGGAG
jgi:hypothetical protein